MKYTLCFCALALTLAGASCRATHEPAAVSPHAEARTATTGPADDAPARPAGVVVQPAQSAISKLLGRPAPAAYALPAVPARIGKKATITVYNAPATITSAGKKATVAAGPGAALTAIGKAKAPLATGAGDVVSQPKATQAAAALGNGNALGQAMPAPPPKKSFLAALGAGIGAWLVPAAGVATVAAALWFGGPLLLAAWRRRKSTSNQA